MTPTLTADRIDLNRVSPEIYAAMIALDTAARQDLDPTQDELIKIRASQINHCANCIDMHTHAARKRGETEQRIYLLSAWREMPELYTERERAALALTEEMTVLSGGEHVSDEVYAQAAAVFGERELGQVIAMALTINAWNRIAVTTRMRPPVRG